MKKTPGKTLSALAAITALALSLGGTFARASSDDAWAKFAVDVERACRKATEGSFVKPSVIVDPFGSESFGLAMVTGKLKGAGSRGTMVCVYDKRTKKVETGSELGEDVIRVEAGRKQ